MASIVILFLFIHETREERMVSMEYISENLQELTMDELVDIDAGKTVFFYIGYALGYAAYYYEQSQLQMTLATGSNMRR